MSLSLTIQAAQFLAVTTLLRVCDVGLPITAAIEGAPWVDMELTGETWSRTMGKDALFTKESIDPLVGMFLGQGGNRKDPLANTLDADLAGLPPIYLQVGSDELLVDDSRKLAAVLANPNTRVSYGRALRDFCAWPRCVLSRRY
jgi:acetyl esterase/lipase